MLTLQGNVRTIAEDADELGVMIRAVRRKKGGEGVYCVTRSKLTQGLMEIIPLAYARMEAKDHDVTVLGLAKGREHALELVRQMVDEMAKNGSLPLG